MDIEINNKQDLDDFAIFIINETVKNIKPYQNGYGLYVDYETIYKNCGITD